MKRNVGYAIVALIAGAGCWFFGLDVVPSIVVALVIAVLLFALRAFLGPIDNSEWPPPPPPLTDGARREVTELDWALRTRRRFIDDRIAERVRHIALSIVRQRHLEIDEPAHRDRIERLVGSQVYLLLVSADRARMTVPALLSVLARLESLERPRTIDRPEP